MSDKIENNCFIAQGEYGRKFIESIHSEIERIKTEQDNCIKDGFERNNDISCKDLFVKPLEFLFKGASNKEPAMMYLAAELLRNEALFYTEKEYDFVQVLEKEAENITCNDIVDMLISAAEHGSPHAQMWCAYGMEKGTDLFEKDLEASKKMLECIRFSLKTLQLTELSFMNDEVEKINDIAYDTYYWWDVYHDKNDRPDVDGESLDIRCGVLQYFMLYLGVLFGLNEENGEIKQRFATRRGCSHECKWFSHNASRLVKAKSDWENWCKEHGMTTVGSDN